MINLIVFSIFSAIGSYWIWRLFLPYPWADILAILGGSAVLISGYILKRRPDSVYNFEDQEETSRNLREKGSLPQSQDTNASSKKEMKEDSACHFFDVKIHSRVGSTYYVGKDGTAFFTIPAQEVLSWSWQPKGG